MADLKQLKIVRDEDFEHRDPLTELTRIMGYAPQSAPNADDFDDFGIDLEAELMGVFDVEDRPVPAAANAPGPTSVSSVDEPVAVDHAADEELESAISAMFEPQAARDPAEAVTPHVAPSSQAAEPFASVDEAAPDAPEAMAFDTHLPVAEPDEQAARSPAEAFEDSASVEEAFAAYAEAFEPAFDDNDAPVDEAVEAEPVVGLADLEPSEVATEPLAAEPFTADPEPAEAAAIEPALDDLPTMDPGLAETFTFPAPDAVPEDELVEAFEDLGDLAAAHPEPQASTADPVAVEPVATRPIPAPAPEPIFDPFAELAAMAVYSADRASNFRARDDGSAAATTSAPAVARTDPPRLYSRANIVAPAAFGAAKHETPRPAAAEAATLAEARHEAAHDDVDLGLDAMIAASSAGPRSSAPQSRPDVGDEADSRGDDAADLDGEAGTAIDDAELDLAFDDAALLDAFADEEPATAMAAPVEQQGARDDRPTYSAEADAASREPAHAGSAASMLGAASAPFDDNGAVDDLDRVLDDMLGEFGLDIDRQLDSAARTDDWTRLDHGQSAWSTQADQPEASAIAAPIEPQADSADPVRAPSAAAPVWDFDGPDLETVEVPERPVEPADELDIPDLAFEDDLPVAAQPDELELQFASAFADLSDAPARQPSYHDAVMASAAGAASMRRSEGTRAEDHDRAAPRGVSHVGHHDAAPSYFEDHARDWDDQYRPDATVASLEPAMGEWPIDEVDASALDEGELASAFHGGADPRRASAPRTRRRGIAVAALVAGVAVVGGVAAYALMRGGGDSAPVVVRADPSPVKVRPETPGGVTVPNQDKAVYERVAGGQNDDTPTQETLVSAREEPVQLNVRDVTPISEGVADDEMEAAPSLKSEDRVEAAEDEFQAPAEEAPVVAPRRVRTMVVRADGTLVPREEPAQVAEAPAPTAPTEMAQPLVEPGAVPATPAAVAAVDETPAIAAQEVVAAAPEAPEPPVRRVETTMITPDNAASQRMPDRGPVAPTRPSEQPVDIVGNAARGNNAQTQVAAVEPAQAPVAAATSEWAMQIASQPTPEGAQASYADLARRHGAILGGRGVNIVKADIPGRGTFWRVRIPAADRAEAVSLCERYKAAGGSCFVAR